ncbi:MAG: TonB-dependent receptor [bacterium]
MKKFWLMIGLGLGLGLGLTFASKEIILAQEPFELEEVVVTATKGEKRIEDVPVSTSVVTQKEIEEKKAVFVDEALKYEPGVYLKRAKFADMGNTVTLRGFSNQNRTLVLLDGQSLNDAYTGNVEWSALPLENVERIEIVEGPVSSLYGGNAMGGVINIITKKPDVESLLFKSSASTNNTYVHSLGYSNKFNRFSLRFNLEKKSSEGERTDFVVKSVSPGTGGTRVTGWQKTKNAKGIDAYLIGDTGKNCWEQNQYSGKFTYSINPISNLYLALNYGQREYGYSDPQSYLKDSNGKPVDNGKIDLGVGTMTIYPKDFLSSWGRYNSNLYHLGYDTLLGLINIKSKISLNKRQSFYIVPQSGATAQGGPGKFNDTAPSQDIQAEIQTDIPFLQDNLLSIGLNYRLDKTIIKEYDLIDWKNEDSKKTTNPTVEIKGKAKISAVYAQTELEVINNLKAFLGARYDTWKNYDGSNRNGTNLTTYTAMDKKSISPKIGFLYKPGFEKGIYHLDNIRASWGKAFKPPTIYELYRTCLMGKTTYESNPNLIPETSQSWEVGLDQRLNKKVTISVTYFQSKIKDLIYSKIISSTIKRKENAGEGKIAGFELDTKVNLTDSLSAFGNYTRQDTEMLENPAEPSTIGKNFVFVPEKMFNLGLIFSKKAVSSSLLWHWVDKVYLNSDNSDTEEEVYGAYDKINTVDAKLGYNLKENLNLSLAVDNLFDKRYYQHYKSPGRTFTVEAKWKY